MNVILVIARLILAVVFAVAGVAKLVDPAGSRRSLGEFGVPVFLARPLALLVPLLELTCAVALIPVASAWWGASGAFAMLLVFMAVIAVSLVRGRRPDCHCFGQLHSSPVGGTTLARNAALAALAALVIWQGPAHSSPGVLDWLGRLNRFEIVVSGVAIAVPALAAFELWALVNVLRQNGRFLLRLEAIEAKLGLESGTPAPGLALDSVAPGFSLAGLDAPTMTLDMLRERGKPVLLFFTAPECSACEAALPVVAQWQREHRDRLTVIPIVRGGEEVNRAKSRKHGLQDVLLQVDREVARAYHVDSWPSAVLVTKGLIASPVAVGADAIRAVVASATHPGPLVTGDLVPSIQLSDLNGEDMDLVRLQGRRTLLLFWNPSCGFCQELLGDLKAWERNRPTDAPELVVISAGSAEVNRKEGFRSTVLLDRNSNARRIFGVGGTPAAVILDENGKVASDIGMGGSAVLALTRMIRAGASSSSGVQLAASHMSSQTVN